MAPGYETVREQFKNNFKKGSEKNAQLCVYVKNEKVIDLWGTATGDTEYNADRHSCQCV